jgi:hypothetical protein
MAGDAPDFIPVATPARKSQEPDFIPAEGNPDGKLLSNTPDDGTVTGTLKNLGTTALKGAAHVPGFFGDIADQAKLAEAGIRSITTDRDRSWKQVMEDIDRQQEEKRKGGQWQPMNGEEIYQRYIAPHVGEYTPTSGVGRYIRAAGEAAVPGGVLGGGLRGVGAGMVSGVAAQGAHDYTDNPFLAFGAGMAAPWLAGKVSSYVGTKLPMSGRAKQAEADKLLYQGTDDPQVALQRLRDRPAGTKETLAEGTMDPGNAAMQEALLTKGEKNMVKTAQDLRTGRNSKMIEAHDELAPEGANPEQVISGFQGVKAGLEGEAVRTADAVPKGAPANEAGGNLRDVTAAKARAESERLDAAKLAIDPDNVLRTPVSLLKDFARATLDKLNQSPFKGRSEFADALYGQGTKAYPGVAKMPDVMKFNDLVDFDQSLTSAIKLANKEGDGFGARQLGDLKDAVKDALKYTEDNGTDAAKRLGQWNKEYGEYKDTYRAGDIAKGLDKEGGGFGNYKAKDADIAGRAFAPGPKGYEQAQMWLKAGGDEGLAQLKQVALGRLHADLKGSFDQAALDKWVAKHRDALRAIDDVDKSFRGQFDQAATARTALHSFEDSAANQFAQMRFGDSVVNEVGRMMGGKRSAEEITNLVQQAQASPNGEAILGGLRRAGAAWMKEKFTLNGMMLPGDGEPVPVIGGAKLKGYINNHRDTLDALFDPKAVDQMYKLSDQVDRSVTVQSLHKNTLSGSPTASRQQALKLLEAQLDAAARRDAKDGTMNVGALIDAEAFIEASREAAGAFGGSGSFAKAGSIGILVLARRALSSALHKYGLGNKADIADMVGKGFADAEVGKLMLERAINENGAPNQAAFDKLAQRLSERAATSSVATQEREQERLPHRASGGRVSELAGHLIKAVDQARKMATTKTKPLLQQDDSMVAQALAIAGKHI